MKEGYKYCCSCNEELPSTKEFFHANKDSIDGLRCNCKKCRKEKIPRSERKYKRCFFCYEIKPNNEAYFHNHSRGGLRSKCKICFNLKSKENHLMSKYNMTILEYEDLHNQQEGKCKICKKSKQLNVDHCHTSGHVRGLLCSNCNTALGMFKDKIQFMENAIEYLKENQK